MNVYDVWETVCVFHIRDTRIGEVPESNVVIASAVYAPDPEVAAFWINKCHLDTFDETLIDVDDVVAVMELIDFTQPFYFFVIHAIVLWHVHVHVMALFLNRSRQSSDDVS